MSKTIRSTIRLVVEEQVEDDAQTHEEANETYESIVTTISEMHVEVIHDQSALETVIILQD